MLWQTRWRTVLFLTRDGVARWPECYDSHNAPVWQTIV